jgi:hypothetical protein
MGEQQDRQNRGMLDRALQRAGRQPHFGTPMRNPDPLFPVARSVMPRPAYEGFFEMPLEDIPERSQDDMDRAEAIDLYQEREGQHETERLAQGPFGRMLAPFTDWARAPETRERIGEGVGRFVEGFTGGEGAGPASDDPNTLGELGDAFGDTVRGVVRSDDFLSAGAQVLAGSARSGRAISDWWNEDENQLSLPYRMGGARSLFSIQPGAEGGPLQGYIPDFAGATTGQPWEDSDWARRGLQFENARLDAFSNNPGQGPVALDTSMRDSYADDMTAAGINAGLNLGFGALDASEVLRAPRLLGAADDLAGEIAFYRSPDGFAETSIDPDGRIVHTYQGGYQSGEGSAGEAVSSMRAAERALLDDIAQNQRPEYYWRPGPDEGGDPRLAQFYRNAFERRTPPGYGFSEAPDGTMRLSRLPEPQDAAGLNQFDEIINDSEWPLTSANEGVEDDFFSLPRDSSDAQRAEMRANRTDLQPIEGGRSAGGEEPDFLAGLNLRQGEGGNWYVADSTGERQSDHIFGARDDAERALANMQNGRPEMEDGLYFDAPTNPTNDLDQWVMGEFEDGAPSRAFVLDDLVDRERNIVRTTPRSDQFDINGMFRDNEWGDDFSIRDRLDRSLGEYGVGGARENTPLLSQAIPLGVGAAGGGAVAYALDGEAEAGEGETDENGDPLLLPILGGVAGAALASRGGRNMRSQVNMFAGPSARTANREALERAQSMAATGATRDEIWADTGWFQGVDGKWRFEIDDSGTRLSDEAVDHFYRGGEGPGRPFAGNASALFQHPEVFDAYPNLSGRMTQIQRTEDPFTLTGDYTNGSGRIRVNAPDTATTRSGLLHETQHGVQREEEFAVGGSPTMGARREDFERLAREIYEESGEITDDQLMWELGGMEGPRPTSPTNRPSWDELTPRQQMEWWDRGRERAYRLLAGETEARNVQTRRDFSPEERRARPPWETQDVPDDQQIIRFDGTVASMAAPSGQARSGRGNADITDTGVRTATIRRTEPGELENTANAIADARRTLRTNREMSLRDWVAKRGGVSDDRGDLRDLNEGRVGWHRIVRESSGRQIDDLATAAWEDGYFTEIPTRDEFIEALRNNSAGRLATGLSDEAAELAVARDTLDQMDQMGVDTTLRGRRQLRESLQEIMPEAAPGRTVEETVDIAFPTNPDQWRDIVGAHPWINSPSRAQAVIMANAKRADGSFAYSAEDILERTGISSSSSLNVTLSKARAAGLPIEIRNHGRAGATTRPNDMLIRALDVMESAPDISREDLARRLGTTTDGLKVLLSQARRGRGSGGRGGALPPELVERTRAIAGRGRMGGDSASAWIAGIIGGGVGGALLFGDEADAQDEMSAEEALDAYGEANDYFGPGYRLVAPRGEPPSIKGAEFIDVNDDQAIMRVGGRVFLVRVAREAGGGPDMAPAGMSIQMLGELEPNQDAGSYSRAGPTALDEEPSGDDADWLTPLRPLASIAAGFGASRLTRNRAVSTLLAGGGAAATDALFGGGDSEQLATGALAAGGRYLSPDVSDAAQVERTVRSPEFAQRRDAFALTLGDETPTLRGQNTFGEIPMGAGGLSLEPPRAEVAEQGYARPIERGTSAQEQFLALEPEDQLWWMENAEGRVARQDELLGDVRAERAALGLDNAFEVTPAPISEARPNIGVNPTRSFPVGFFDPATGEALFGSAGRRGPPPRPRKAFDQLAPTGQARRVGGAPDQIALAQELGLGEFQKGAEAMRAIRDRATADPAFMEMLKNRFPTIAAMILGGGALASEVADEGDWLR